MSEQAKRKMPTRGRGKPSTVATHPQLAAIELAIANEIPLDKIAQRFGVSRDAVHRYKNARMTPERLAMLRYRTGESPIDLHRLKESEAELVVQRNVTMLSELWSLYRLCVETKDFRTAARAASEYRAFAELQAKIVGELVQADRHLHLHVADSPEYRRLVAVVMAWCSDKPDLAAELAHLLEDAERTARAPLIEGKAA